MAIKRVGKSEGRYFNRAVALMGEFGIGPIERLGLFPLNSYLETIEYVLHELAHGFTAGFLKFPSELSAALPGIMERFGTLTRDHLEIDTTYVTFHTLLRLKLVTADRLEDFADKCSNAMDSDHFSGKPMLVMSEFEARGCAPSYKQEADEALTSMVSDLTSMMRAPLKLVLSTFALAIDARPYQPTVASGP